ncbi:MAG: TPM domain-containing protein [Proteobacteria bacterium]|nr:TPM domain-containing protein [Pseudomonadota bacterium]
MTTKALEFFTPEDKQYISNSIMEAETNTSGEIAIMVLDSSDSYKEAEMLGAFVLSSFSALILEIIKSYYIAIKAADWSYNLSGFSAHFLAEAFGHTSIWTYIPILFILYFPVKFIFSKYPKIKIPFLSTKRIDEAVKERAVRAFYEKGLYKTRDETGILIFISILEHRVWILGDKGINEKIAPEFWSKIAKELSEGIKRKEQGKAASHAIEECGKELAKYFPIKHDDTNELSNEVML